MVINYVFNCRVLSAVKLFVPDAVVKKSRQVSNEKVIRSSSSVVTQSVKRPRGKFHRKSYNPALFKTFRAFFSFFLLLKNSYMNNLSVIFEGAIRCSCHFNLSD